MNVKLILSGKVVPRDRKVNETTVDYLDRKFKEIEHENSRLRVELEILKQVTK